MKKIAAATAFVCLATTAAQADGYADPVVEPEVIIEAATADSSAPSATLVLALMTVAVFGAALTHN